MGDLGRCPSGRRRAVAGRRCRHPSPPRPHVVLLHVEAGDDEVNGHLHLGPGLPHALRRFLACDSRVRAVLERGGKPVSVGRAFRTVPERTRVVVEDRDRGCRGPGCERRRWLHVHHIRHWEDGGESDTTNLVCLCSRHHLAKLGIDGNADEPGGLTFTDERGRALAATSPPTRPHPHTDNGCTSHPAPGRIRRARPSTCAGSTSTSRGPGERPTRQEGRGAPRPRRRRGPSPAGGSGPARRRWGGTRAGPGWR